MARRRSRTLTEVELEFMQVVWNRDEVTTEDVREALAAQARDLTGGSVRKVLSILVDKGYLTRRQEGRGFIYRATVPEEEANRNLLADLLGRAFDGSAALMVAALLDARPVSHRELEEIKRLIAQREAEEQP